MSDYFAKRLKISKIFEELLSSAENGQRSRMHVLCEKLLTILENPEIKNRDFLAGFQFLTERLEGRPIQPNIQIEESPLAGINSATLNTLIAKAQKIQAEIKISDSNQCPN